MVTEVVGLRDEVIKINKSVEEIKVFLSDKRVVVNTGHKNLFHKYSVQIPLVNLNIFDQYEEKLKSNSFLRADVVSPTQLIIFVFKTEQMAVTFVLYII